VRILKIKMALTLALKKLQFNHIDDLEIRNAYFLDLIGTGKLDHANII